MDRSTALNILAAVAWAAAVGIYGAQATIMSYVPIQDATVASVLFVILGAFIKGYNTTKDNDTLATRMNKLEAKVNAIENAPKAAEPDTAEN